MDIENTFARALGRAPSPKERERLVRLRDAFDLSDNDSLWVVALLLECYNVLYRQYPDQCAEASRRGVQEWLSSVEARETLGRLASSTGAGTHSSTPPDSRRHGQPEGRRDLYWLTLSGFGTTLVVLLGSACFAAGTAVRTGALPSWVQPSSSPFGIAAQAVLGAPAGWLVLLVLIVPALYAEAWGWRRGRDLRTSRWKRWSGWAAFVGVALAIGGWVVLVTCVCLV